MDLKDETRKFHRNKKGKIGTVSLASISNKEELSLAYTPGVGTIVEDIAKDNSLAYEYTLKSRTVAIVSDGTSILGLGNLGPLAAIPVMEGKAAIFKEFAGVDAFPICLNTSDTEEIIKTIKAIEPVFGGINLEDISAPRCFEIEARLRRELAIPVMHDDQHGTAIVVLAGLINALKLRDLSKEEARIAVSGAGSAGIAIINILLNFGFKNISVVDSVGLISNQRDDLKGEKLELLRTTNLENLEGGLKDALKDAHVFIGVSKAGVLTEELVSVMYERPIIFALANPVPEIMPDLAMRAGAYIVATGRSDFPNQINNALAFPGLFAGALESKKQFSDEIFMKAAIALASLKEPEENALLPDLFDERIVPAIKEVFFE